ncbi:MAG: coproporphyrinogen III oxidase [Alphaproteobacteria bacterium]|nr:coproporphyrinogen III oxidase [Alphaproteobacteria bacterium]
MSDADPIGIYVHWPFCVSKCPYCDFNSHVRERIDETAWRDALIRELGHWAAVTGERRVGSIFFGGGTPSLMAPATVDAVLAFIAGRWKLAETIEVTLEANPNSIEVERFRSLRAAGVGRVSIGVQSFDDTALRFLGRAHDSREARRAIEVAAATFARWSFDLIYARPGQGEAAWRQELETALVLAGGHLSLYQLTIEPGTRFAQLAARGDLVPLEDERAAVLYETTIDRLAAAGLADYEVSNFARAGEESRHNLVYWRYGDYLGVGPGAHGRITLDGRKLATRAERAPETWIERVTTMGHGLAERIVVAPGEAAREALLMGLRLAEGIDAERFRRATGIVLEDALDPRGVARALSGGLLERTPAGIAATRSGRLVLDALLAEIAR